MSTGHGHAQGSEDAEQAKWLAEALGSEYRYDHTAERWHHWTGVRWAPDKVKDLHERVIELTTERLKTVNAINVPDDDERKRLVKVYRRLFELSRIESALRTLATSDGYKTDGADWDQDAFLLGCENGIVDLRVNALVDQPGPSLLVTKTTGQKFVPLKEWTVNELRRRAPRFMEFMVEVTSGDPGMIDFILRWYGYTLFGTTEEQKFLILIGTGRNGKGALMNTMRSVIGEYTADTDQNLYMKTRYGAARSDGARADLMALKGKRFAVMEEPEGGQFNEELLKAHTGGVPITARALHSNNVISWVPTHTITFLTNKAPRVEDVGPSMQRRVLVADFRERFDGEREDKHLYDKLKLESEGILAILCWAAKAWYEDGLTIPQRILDASEAYITQNDPIGKALDEFFVVKMGVSAGAKVLYETYLEWHAQSDNPNEAMSLTAFGTNLGNRGFTKKKTEKGIVYTNIRPKTASELAEQPYE